MIRLLILLSLISSFAFSQNSVKTNQRFDTDSVKQDYTSTTGTGSFGMKANDWTFISPNGTYTKLSTLISNVPNYNTYVDFSMISNVVAINNTAYYKKVMFARSMTVTGVIMWIDGLAAGTYDVALYNSAGTKIASRASRFDPSAVGKQTIAFDTPVSISAYDLVWVCVAGSNGAGETFGLMPTDAINNSAYGFVMNTTTTVGASLPTPDASTTYRFWIEFY